MNLRKIAVLPTCAALAFGAAACGGDDEGSSGSSGSGSGSSTQERPEPVAEVPSLSGQSTSVKLDAGFVEALTMLKLTPAPVGDGKITKSGSAVFPITGGNVKYFKPGSVSPYVQGRIDHAGSGLSLTGGGKKVELTDFIVDPGKSVLTGTVSVDGEVAAENAPLFFLDGRTLQPLRTADGGRAILEGTTVKLKAEAADLLNKTFEVDALKEGLEIGVAKIVINTEA